MTVTWVGGSGNNSATTFTVPLPAGWQPGDLAILICSGDSAVDPVYNAGAGWTLAGHWAAGNMHSYLFYRVLQAGDTGANINIQGTAAIGVWRNAAWVGLGTPGIRPAVAFTVTAPAFASASGIRLHLFGDRTTQSTAAEADTLHTLTYGTPRYFYPGDTTVGAAIRIGASYFSDSLSGSGDNTATMADSSGNAWGVQIAINDTSPAVLPKTETLTDTFDTTVDKVTKWPATSTATVWDTGRAKIPCVTNYWNLGTLLAGSHDFTGSYIYAKVTPPPTGNGSRETFMEVIRGGVSSDKLTIYVSGSNLYVARKLAGVTSGSSDLGAYSSTTHAWWRIREAAGTTYFDTSPDGATWTQKWSVANGFDVTKVWVNFSTGYWGTETASDTFVDNVNTAPASTTGRPKAYVAGSFQKKPGKVYMSAGSGFVEKPWKQWTGTIWKALT